MRVAIYTLTRDRAEYTQRSFAALRERAGCEYDHFIWDNGSIDNTWKWLLTYFHGNSGVRLWQSADNLGISRASNCLLREILNHGNYDLIVKMDNDCILQTPNLLAYIARIYETDPAAQRWALSPRVIGINRQPKRVGHVVLAGHPIGPTGVIGGLFHVLPAAMYREFLEDGGYDEKLPLAYGQDQQLCEWLRAHGYNKGYIEDLVVEHCEGTDVQAKRYPDYFARKWREEKAVSG